MRVGVVFPQTEIGEDPGAIRDFVQTAEGLGYSHLFVYDHVVGAVHEGREPPLTGPYTEETPFHEPFVLLGFIAAQTSTLGLATGILILPQRQTALVAKQAAEVDILSGGRLRLGVGSGWNHVEYDVLGEAFHSRGRRLGEQVVVLRKLWTEPVVEFRGEWHHIDRAGIRPLPGREIPIWFGGWSDRALRRAARLGDGMIPQFSPGNRGKALMERLWAYLDESGRSRESFGIEAQVSYGAGPEKWTEHARTWKGLGATFVSIQTMNANLATAQDHLRAIERYAREVGTTL